MVTACITCGDSLDYLAGDAVTIPYGYSLHYVRLRPLTLTAGDAVTISLGEHFAGQPL